MTHRANIRDGPGIKAQAELVHIVEEGHLAEVSARGRFLSDESQQAESDALTSVIWRLES